MSHHHHSTSLPQLKTFLRYCFAFIIGVGVLASTWQQLPLSSWRLSHTFDAHPHGIHLRRLTEGNAVTPPPATTTSSAAVPSVTPPPPVAADNIIPPAPSSPSTPANNSPPPVAPSSPVVSVNSPPPVPIVQGSPPNTPSPPAPSSPTSPAGTDARSPESLPAASPASDIAVASLTITTNSNDSDISSNAHKIVFTTSSAVLEKKAERPGVIVLGMHRSGTSLLTGLMSMTGLKTGEPLLDPTPENPKGYFERKDLFLQNEGLFMLQNINYANGTYRYDPMRGLVHILKYRHMGDFFINGTNALMFLNGPANYPWIVKDPRLCITIRTWLPLLNFLPAVLFTYRHPLDSAKSIHDRTYEKYDLSVGLKMWYVYNRRAIMQSHDLCRVVTSARRVVRSTESELKRVYEELKFGCGVPIPRELTREDISSFIDMSLQHGRTSLSRSPCEHHHADHAHVTRVWNSTHHPERFALYRECLRVYCAMEDGAAFSPSFEWNFDIRDE
eukprot:gene2492-2730_t